MKKIEVPEKHAEKGQKKARMRHPGLGLKTAGFPHSGRLYASSSLANSIPRVNT